VGNETDVNMWRSFIRTTAIFFLQKPNKNGNFAVFKKTSNFKQYRFIVDKKHFFANYEIKTISTNTFFSGEIVCVQMDTQHILKIKICVSYTIQFLKNYSKLGSKKVFVIMEI
jgi:hypothetical protein